MKARAAALRAETIACAVVVGVALTSGTHLCALGAEPLRVVVIARHPRDAVAARIRDEATALGFVVDSARDDRSDLEAIAAERHASAALRVDASSRAVEIWVDPRRDLRAGAAALQLVREDPYDEGEPASALALRVVELLRGRLLKVVKPAPSSETGILPPSAAEPTAPAAEPTASAAEPTASAASAAPATPADRRTPAVASATVPVPTARRVALSMAGGFLTNAASHLTVAGAAFGGVRWMFAGRAGADAVIVLPVVPATATASSGTVHVAAGALGLGFWIDLVDPASVVTTGGGAGLAAGVLGFDGEASAPSLQGVSGALAFALPYARWAVAWHALPPLALRLEALAGLAAPRPVVRLDATTEVTFGRPLFGLGIGLEMSIP